MIVFVQALSNKKVLHISAQSKWTESLADMDSYYLFNHHHHHRPHCYDVICCFQLSAFYVIITSNCSYSHLDFCQLGLEA